MNFVKVKFAPAQIGCPTGTVGVAQGSRFRQKFASVSRSPWSLCPRQRLELWRSGCKKVCAHVRIELSLHNTNSERRTGLKRWHAVWLSSTKSSNFRNYHLQNSGCTLRLVWVTREEDLGSSSVICTCVLLIDLAHSATGASTVAQVKKRNKEKTSKIGATISARRFWRLQRVSPLLGSSAIASSTVRRRLRSVVHSDTQQIPRWHCSRYRIKKYSAMLFDKTEI